MPAIFQHFPTIRSFTLAALTTILPGIAQADFAGGDGSSDAPWQISTAAQLAEVKNDLDAHYILTADINLDVSPWNTGSGWEPIGSNCGDFFGGRFDGNYHTISGMTISRPDKYFVGLFGCVHDAVLRNIVIESSSVTGWSRAGGLAGHIVNSIVIDSSYSGDVETRRSSSPGDIGGIQTGGLIGSADHSAIIDSSASGNVDAYDEAGGLVGFLDGSLVSNSFSTSTVTAVTDSGAAKVGGLVAYSSHGSIRNSYSDSAVNGEGHVGALVGNNYIGAISSSFWNSDTAAGTPGLGYSISGGVVVVEASGKSSADLQSSATFTDAAWNMDTIWTLPPSGYPIQRWVDEPVNTPPLVFPALADQQVKMDVALTLNTAVHFIDPDADALDFTASGLPDGLLIDAVAGVISGTPHSLGNHNVTVTARDTKGHIITATFSLVVDPLFTGAGTIEDPWQIDTLAKLNAMRFSPSAYFVLTENLDLGAAPWNEGSGWEPIGTTAHPFTGTLDGNDKVISNLFIDRAEDSYVGLFGQVKGATIHNLSLQDVSINGGAFAGGLAAYFWESNASNISVTGTVTTASEDNLSGETGGLTGYASGSTISDSHFTGTISGVIAAGGLAGSVAGASEISDSHAQVSVNSGSNAGGLVGTLSHASIISNSFARGSVESDFNTGGLVGRMVSGGILRNSFALTSVHGRQYTGGLTGRLIEASTVSDSYVQGDVSGELQTAGLTGLLTASSISNSYAVVTISGDVASAALAAEMNDATINDSFWSASHAPGLQAAATQTGTNSLSDTQGLTTATLQDKEHYLDAGWNFTGLWDIAPPNDYPFHVWSGPQDFNIAPVSGSPVATWELPIATDLSFDVASYFVDPNGDTLGFTFENLADGLEAEGSVISGSTMQMGDHVITVKVTDPDGLSITTTFTLRVKPYALGNGSSEDPWQISLPEQLQAIGENLSAHYRLSGDIDLDVAPWNTGAGWVPPGSSATPFTGSLDGNGHIISGLFINTANEFSGLFGYAEQASFSDLTLREVSITGGDHTGALAGYLSDSTVSRVLVQGDINGNAYTAGLAGSMAATQVYSSHASVTVIGADFTAGLAGIMTRGSALQNSYVLGAISGADAVAALVAHAEDSAVANSYAVATIAGDSLTAALVAESDNTAVSNSFWSADLMQGLAATAMSQNGSTLDNVSGPSVVEMRKGEIFESAGWDFANLWDISDAGSYPFHQWAGVQEFNTPPVPVAAIPEQQLRSGGDFSLDLANYLIDVDGDELSFVSPNLPAGLSLNASTGVISGSTSALGWHDITISATDTAAATMSASVRISVISFASGDGSSAAPWPVGSATQLDELRAYPAASAYLTQDIDLGGDSSDGDFFNEGRGWSPLGSSATPFTGSLDGNGHVISGLFIRDDLSGAGLFGFAQDALFNNILLVDVDIIAGDHAGGIVGYLEGGSISNSYVSGAVTAESNAGGLAGSVLDGTVSNSLSDTTVQAETAPGGLLGEMAGTGSISNSYSLGTVTGASAGGLLGILNEASLADSYAAATTSGAGAGGVIGTRILGNVSQSYWLDGGELPGAGTGSSSGLAGLNQSAMRDQASFEGWDFATVWQQSALYNAGYPYLAWAAQFAPRQYLPVLSTVEVLGPVIESETLTLSFAQILAASDATDQDGSIEAFAVSALHSGSLLIGGAAYDSASNYLISASSPAEWTSVWEETGEDRKAFTITAIDNEGLQSNAAVTLLIEVTEMPNRDPEAVSVIASQHISTGSEFRVDISTAFSDPDDDELTFTATGLPEGLDYSAGGVISGLTFATGAFDIVLVATDPELATAQSRFTLTVTSFSSGDGSISAPWQITSATQFAEMSLMPAAHYVLTTDIDLGGNSPDGEFWHAGAGWLPIGTADEPFTGSLDGGRHIISGLYVNRPDMTDLGLFGYVIEATLRNIMLESLEITGDSNVGGLAGTAEASRIERSSITGAVTGSGSVGGVIGNSLNCQVIASNVEGTVTGNTTVGGLIGFSTGTTIVNSFTITEVFGDFSGGIAGMFVTGSSIENSYTISSVTPSPDSIFSGALAGFSDTDDLENSFWHEETAGELSGIGFSVSTGANIRPLTETQMKSTATFTEAGWDFETLWAADAAFNSGYPYQQWMYTPAPVIPDTSSPTVDDTQEGVSLSGSIVITDNGVVNGGSLSGTISNNGLITGNVVLGGNTIVSGGQLGGTLNGQSGAPGQLRDVSILPGTTLSNVIISGNSRLPANVVLGPKVLFASEETIPAGINLSSALNQLQWLTGDEREVIDLSGNVLTGLSADAPLSIIGAIQQLDAFEPSANEIEQDDTSGEIVFVTSEIRSTVLPVHVSKAEPGAPEGVFINTDGNVVFVTSNHRVVVSHPVLIESSAFADALRERGLQLTYNENTNLTVSPAPSGNRGAGNALAALSEDVYYSARPDVTAVKAFRGDTAGLVEYPQPELGNIRGISLLFEDETGQLLQQDIAPVPADWPALKQTLSTMPGFADPSISTNGIISVRVDGVLFQALSDYAVGRHEDSPDAGVTIREAGDLSGNGMLDYEIRYPNGDRQYLYLFPVVPQ